MCGNSAHKPLLNCASVYRDDTEFGVAALLPNYCGRNLKSLSEFFARDAILVCVNQVLRFYFSYNNIPAEKKTTRASAAQLFIPWVDVQVAWHIRKTKFYSVVQKKFHIPVQRLPSGSACQWRAFQRLGAGGGRNCLLNYTLKIGWCCANSFAVNFLLAGSHAAAREF